jgi:hypothetical protein
LTIFFEYFTFKASNQEQIPKIAIIGSIGINIARERFGTCVNGTILRIRIVKIPATTHEYPATEPCGNAIATKYPETITVYVNHDK